MANYASLHNPAAAGEQMTYTLDKWKQLNRFLILGTDSPAYRASAAKLTELNAKAVLECIKEDGKRTVDTIVEISTSGRAPKNEPALYAFALAVKYGNAETKAHALTQLQRVARIGTHLYHTLDYFKALKIGWGRSTKRAVANWFTKKPADKLGLQVVKYQQRDGRSAHDCLRLSHPKSDDPTINAIMAFVAGKEYDVELLPKVVQGHILAKRDTTTSVGIVHLIKEYGIPRESIPSNFLNEKNVWTALLENQMPLEAMMRNLPKMTVLGLMDDLATREIVTSSLRDPEKIKASKLHPLKILVALKTYASGAGEKGKLVWKPRQEVIDSLDEAFYLAFGNVESTGKKIMLALDISGSMQGSQIAGMPLTAMEAMAAMVLITKRVEPNADVYCFQGGLTALPISPRMRLDDVLKTLMRISNNWDCTGTNCAAPMQFATANKVAYDAFVVYTDNDTNRGGSPSGAMKKYRTLEFAPDNSKLAVIASEAYDFTIADPQDPNMMDFVGFDTSTPTILSDFIADRI